MKMNRHHHEHRPITVLFKIVRIGSELTKAPQSLMITITALFSFIIKKPFLHHYFFLTGISVFLLICGSAALNNYQDRLVDSRMERTKNRVLPSHKIDAGAAFIFAVILIFTGLAGLYLIGNSLNLLILGSLGVVIYNFVYTPLKRKTVLAIIPGSICGMLPPIIGWSAAGGYLFSLDLIILAAIFGVWQIPHYWSILFLHAQDYRTSGLNNMFKFFSPYQLHKMLFIWILSFSLITLMLPFVHIIISNVAHWLLFINTLILITVFSYQLFIKSGLSNYRLLSILLHSSLAFIILLGTVERMI